MVKINPKLLLEAIYPVGSIFINTTGTNPGTFLGGTWQSFGSGRVLVGRDTNDGDFDTLGETGGSKQHKHLTALGFDSSYLYGYAGNDSNPAYGSEVVYNIKRNALSGFSQTDNEPARLVYTANESSLQPYIVVSMWQRTA